jgi:hypothetical protein
MTNYHNKTHTDKDETPIVVGYDISKDYSPAPICKYCRRDLIALNGGEYLCSTCNISFFPESEGMRTKPRLTTSSGRNTVPYVKLGPDPNDRFYKKPVDYKGGIGQLAKRGTMHIIDYTEQGGGGKILGSRKSRSKSKK